MTQFIRAANPIWWLPDLTGLPLNDEYYAFFLTNDLPYVPQPVFQDPNGISPWPYILQFQPSGTLPNNLYFDDTLVYRIEIRHGNNSSSPLIWLIENFVPGGDGGSIPSNTPFLDAENMITNPTFSDVYFTTPFTFTRLTPGNYSIPIGPGWRLDLVGSGTIVLSQIAFPGFPQPPTIGDPNYYLHIDASSGGGFSSIKLIQRFSNNPFIFENGAIAVSFTAQAYTNPETLTIVYQPSNPQTSGQVIYNVPPISVGGFNAYANAVNLTVPNNQDQAPDGYVEIQFNIFPSAILDLTNIQVVGQTEPLGTSPSPSSAPIYRQQTYERMVDHEFNVYKNSLLTQPKESLLAGWTFGLNPWQFTNPAIANVPDNRYTADQTIIVQQNFVNSGVGNNISVGRGTVAQNYVLSVNAVTANNKFAVIQYIDKSTMRPYWGEILSSMVNAKILTSHGTNAKFKMRLIWRSTAVPIIGQNEPILSWLPGTGANTEPVFSAGWTAISPFNGSNDPEYLLTSDNLNFAFDQFQLPAATTDTMYLGIVIYTTNELNQNATADNILINRVSLVPNDFAIDASIETFDSSLKKCQEYLERSYDPNVPTQTTTYSGSSTINNPGLAVVYGLDRPFKATKVNIPVVTWIAPFTGNINNVTNATTNADVPVTGVNSYVSKISTGIPTQTTSNPGQIAAHWVADSRLGVF
jgi:hypothetical protein